MIKKLLTATITSLVTCYSSFPYADNTHDYVMKYKDYNLYSDEEKVIIKMQDLSQLYTGRRAFWFKGNYFKVIILPYNSLMQKDFVITVLGISNSRFKELTSKKSKNLKKVKSEEDMLIELKICDKCIGLLSDNILFYNNGKEQFYYVRIEP